MNYDIKEVVLDNGLKIYHTCMPEAKDMTLIANVNIGSAYEDFSTKEISHFVEHMLFRGTKKRPNYTVITNEIERFGDKMICYTGEINIPLGMTVPTQNFEEVADFISDLLYNSKLEQSDMEIERKLILNEIGLREDNNRLVLKENLFKNLYENSYCFNLRTGRDQKDNVIRFSQKEIRQFYDDYFTPDNTHIFYAGPESLDYSAGIISKCFPSNFRKSKTKKDVVIKESQIIPKRTHMVTSTNSTYVATGLPVMNPTEEEGLALKVLEAYLKRNLRKKLVNDSGLSYRRHYEFYKLLNSGTLYCYATCNPRDREMVEDVLFEEFKNYEDGKIEEDDIKSRMDIMENLSKHAVDSKTNALLCMENCMNGDVYKIRKLSNIKEYIKPETVIETAKNRIKTSKLSTSILGR